MFMVWGDWFTGGVQSTNTQNLLDSVIISNKTIIRRTRVPTYEVHTAYWRNDPEIQKDYWAASPLVSTGTLIVLALIVLLMVLFKRCPRTVGTIVGSVLGIIIIFTVCVSINHAPIYV